MHKTICFNGLVWSDPNHLLSNKARIRNHLIAQCFPEMDDYFSYGEGPAIVKWCLDPAELTNLPFEEFVSMVSSRNTGENQRRRLLEVHKKAASSIGCKVTPSVSFEAKILLEELQQLHIMILETDKKIAEVCTRFPEYVFLLSIPGFGPDISAKVRESPMKNVEAYDLAGDNSGPLTRIMQPG